MVIDKYSDSELADMNKLLNLRSLCCFDMVACHKSIHVSICDTYVMASQQGSSAHFNGEELTSCFSKGREGDTVGP